MDSNGQRPPQCSDITIQREEKLKHIQSATTKVSEPSVASCEAEMRCR